MPITAVNDAEFDHEVLRSALPVLVDFGAEWCQPCKRLEPVVEELAAEWTGRVKVMSLDIDSNLATTEHYGIMGVPTLILFVEGEARERISGYQSKARLLDTFTPHLNR
jgi:thioredoxin 1